MAEWWLLVSCCLWLLAGCGTSQKVAEHELPVSEAEGLPINAKILRWRQFIEEQQSASVKDKLVSVNQFFNKLNFIDDQTHWGQEDYWATPEEMLITEGGDCEDFSIAKYFTLKRLMIPEERMRLTYVKSLLLKQPHMVLSYYPTPKADPLVLDNVVKTIVPASQRPDLIPVYSFNAQGLWLAKQRGAGQRVGDSTQNSMWKDLLMRMNQESGTN